MPHRSVPARPILAPKGRKTPRPPDDGHALIFAALLHDLKRAARRLSRSATDADDLVQETLLRVWARMAMAASGASDAAPVDDLRAYAFATLRHCAYARHPARLRSQTHSDTDTDTLPAPRGSDASARLACAETLAALAALPEDQRHLLSLRAVDGLSYGDIAAQTGLPLGTVTSRLARGRAALRQALGLPPGAPIADLLDSD